MVLPSAVCRLRLFFFGPLFALLAGCSNIATQQQASPYVHLSPSLAWHLPSLSVLPGDFQVTQQAQAHYQGDSFELVFQIEKKHNQLAIAAMAPNGLLLIQLRYDGQHVTGSVSPLIRKKVSLPYLVSDLMLAFGKADQLRKALDTSDIRLSESDHQRVISNQGQPLITISYNTQKDGANWPKNVVYNNKALGYSLTIETLSQQPL